MIALIKSSKFNIHECHALNQELKRKKKKQGMNTALEHKGAGENTQINTKLEFKFFTDIRDI